MFSQDPYSLGKLSAFNKATPQKAAPETHQFCQKATNHLNILTSVRARAHITECYNEIDLLKAEVADMKRDKAFINALLTVAKTKIRSINRQGLIYESSKRDVSTMKSKRSIANAYETPSDKDRDRNNQRQIHNTVASAIGVVHKQSPNASHEACSLIISGIAAEFLPDDHNDSEENNAALIQITKNFISVWRIIHAMVTQHHCDEHIRLLHQVLLMFVVGEPKQQYSACSIKSIMSKLGINDSKSRLVAAVANTRKNLFVLIEDKGGVNIVVDNVGRYVTELQPFFKGIARAENKNAISPEKIARIIESYYRNSEASPKKDDVVKKRIDNFDFKKNTEYICKQKRFATATEKETRLDHMNFYQEHVSVGMFSVHKPFEIYPATVNTCKCQTCEGNRLLKVAIMKQAKKINEPVHLFVDVYLVLLRFKRSLLLLKKKRKENEDSKVTMKTVFLMFEVFASVFPIMAKSSYNLLPYRKSLLKLSQLSLTEMVTNVLCTNALPTECNGMGQIHCYGLTDKKNWCKNCFEQQQCKIITLLDARINEPSTMKQLKEKLQELNEKTGGSKHDLQQRLN